MELAQERLRLLQIACIETLSEPSIDWRQQAVCPIVLSPIAPELSEAHGAAQLERFRLLPLRDADRTPEAGLAFGKAPPGHHERPSQPVNFGLPPALAAFFAYRQCIRQRRERTLMVPGAAVFVIGSKQDDGKLTSTRLYVEKDGIKPPM